MDIVNTPSLQVFRLTDSIHSATLHYVHYAHFTPFASCGGLAHPRVRLLPLATYPCISLASAYITRHFILFAYASSAKAYYAPLSSFCFAPFPPAYIGLTTIPACAPLLTPLIVAAGLTSLHYHYAIPYSVLHRALLALRLPRPGEPTWPYGTLRTLHVIRHWGILLCL